MPIIKSQRIYMMVGQFLLAILVLAFGYFSGTFVRKYYDQYKPTFTNEQSGQESIKETPASTTQVGENDQYLLVDGEKIKVPRESATDQEKGAFSVKVMELAQDSDQVTINDCVFSPPIVKKDLNSTLAIYNNDIIEQSVKVGQKEGRIPPKSLMNFDLELDNGVGLYGLLCRGKLTGMLYATQ